MTVFLSGKHLLAWLLRSVPGCTSRRSAERVASLHSPFPLRPRARREEGGGTVLATLGPLSRKVFPEASRIPLLTSHWPVLGHMATCHSKRGWESIPLLLFSGGRNQRLEMAVGSARWQRLPQSMRAKDFPSDGSVGSSTLPTNPHYTLKADLSIIFAPYSEDLQYKRKAKSHTQ